MSAVYIYGLIDPDTREVHYIGATTEPERRLTEHLSPSLRKSKERAKWIMGLLSQDKKPELIVLRESNDINWKEDEARCIEEYRNQNAPLTNSQKGGEGGVSEAHRRYLDAMHNRNANVTPAPPAFFIVHLKELTLKKGAKRGDYISQKELHALTGVPLKIILAWYKGQVRQLDARAVFAFITFFGCRMSDLVSSPTVYVEEKEESES